jgi:hypothetical protein
MHIVITSPMIASTRRKAQVDMLVKNGASVQIFYFQSAVTDMWQKYHKQRCGEFCEDSMPSF